MSIRNDRREPTPIERRPQPVPERKGLDFIPARVPAATPVSSPSNEPAPANAPAQPQTPNSE